jgi:hypothetical protein
VSPTKQGGIQEVGDVGFGVQSDLGTWHYREPYSCLLHVPQKGVKVLSDFRVITVTRAPQICKPIIHMAAHQQRLCPWCGHCHPICHAASSRGVWQSLYDKCASEFPSTVSGSKKSPALMVDFSSSHWVEVCLLSLWAGQRKPVLLAWSTQLPRPGKSWQALQGGISSPV